MSGQLNNGTHATASSPVRDARQQQPGGLAPTSSRVRCSRMEVSCSVMYCSSSGWPRRAQYQKPGTSCMAELRSARTGARFWFPCCSSSSMCCAISSLMLSSCACSAITRLRESSMAERS
eukprot:scaffold10505_cov102-Isochrysis_galbana.AAC.6